MGKNNRRQMGSFDNSRRAKIRVHFKTKVDRNKRNLCTCQKSTYYSYRGRKFIRKGCHRTCPNFSIQQRFLQYVLPSSKKDRRFKTNNKSSTAEQVYVETTFSNGYTDKSVKFGKAKRLGNISGSDRRIFTHSDTQVPSEISSFQHSGTSVSVPGSSVRSFPESTLFHQNYLSSNSSFEDVQHASSLISRRLAYSKCNQENVAVRSREIAQSFAQTGVFGKLGEIILSTQSEYYFHRSSIPVSEKYSTSKTGEDSQIAFSHSQFDRRSQHGTQFFTPFGANGLMYRTDSQCQTIHETNTITPSSFLETGHKRYAIDSASYTTPKRSFEVVARYSKHYSGQVFSTMVRPDHNHNRCFQNWFLGSHEKSDLSGLWTKTEAKQHINILEMEAVIRTIKYFLPQLQGQNVLLRCDNTTVVQNCQRQGGTRSVSLCYKTWELYQMTIKHRIQIRAAHLAGHKNILADQLSRTKVLPLEWGLNDQIMNKIFAIWGKPMIDLFASDNNHKLPIYCSWIPSQKAFAIDALSIPWNNMEAYAFPPICLVPKVLAHIALFHCRIILIAPQWPRRHWYTNLLQSLIDYPRRLPVLNNLLHQPKTRIYHPNPEMFNLTAWLLSTKISEIQGFQQKLENCSQLHGEQGHNKTMLANSRSSIVGVVNGKKIPILPF